MAVLASLILHTNTRVVRIVLERKGNGLPCARKVLINANTLATSTSYERTLRFQKALLGKGFKFPNVVEYAVQKYCRANSPSKACLAATQLPLRMDFPHRGPPYQVPRHPASEIPGNELNLHTERGGKIEYLPMSRLVDSYFTNKVAQHGLLLRTRTR